MNDPLLPLQVACLTGGHIIKVGSVKEAELFQRLAVGLMPDIKTFSESQESLKNFFEAITVHPICPENFATQFLEAYRGHNCPEYYLLGSVKPNSSPPTTRFFVYANQKEQFDQAINKNTLLIVCSDMNCTGSVGIEKWGLILS